MTSSSTIYPMLNIINSLLSPSCLPRIQPLQPDRPASSYIMSQLQYQQSLLTEHLSQQQTQHLKDKIQQLQSQLSQKNSIIQTKQLQSYQHILLLKIQIQRVRTIMRQQGYYIQQQSVQFNQLQAVYKLKLQQLRHSLCRQFEQELKTKQSQSLLSLQQIRQLYIQKIGVLTQSYQQQLKQKQLQLHSMNGNEVNMRILQMKQKQSVSKIEQLKEQNRQLVQQVYELRRVVEQQRQYRSNEMGENQHKEIQLRIKYEQCIKTNTQLKKQLTLITNNINTTQSSHIQSIIKLNDRLQNKQQQMQMLKWKCHKLEEQLDEFKNRKTQGLGNINSNNGGNGLGLMEGNNNYGNSSNMMMMMANGNNTMHMNSNNNNNNNNYPNNNTYSNNIINTNPDRLDTQQRISYQHPRFQTQSRISYQQSIKKIHQMQAKIQQLSQQLYKTNGQNQLLVLKIDQQKNQIQDNAVHIAQLKKYLIQKDIVIQSVMAQQQQSNNVGSSSNKISVTNSTTTQSHHRDIMIIQQKDITISNLNKQLQQKSNLITKMQRQIQKLNKNQKQYQIKLITTEQMLQTKIKNKQNQLKNIRNQLKLKDNEMQQIRQKINNQLKSKQQEYHKDVEKLKQQSQYDIKQKDTELKNIKQKCKQSQQLSTQKDKLINMKDQQIIIKDKQINDLKSINKQLNSLKNVVRKSVTNKVNKQDDPFADPFIRYQQQQQQLVLQVVEKHYVPSANNPYQQPLINSNSQNSNTIITQLQTKLSIYQQKIHQLQLIVLQLRFQWGATEQNENGIFSYIKESYIDQIKVLRQKNQQMEKSMKYSTEFIQIMAKKQSSMESGEGGMMANSSKSKSKGKK